MAASKREPVFTEARDKALQTGRCMACDERLTSYGRPRVVCKTRDCRRYYFTLWSAQFREYDAEAAKGTGGGRYKRVGKYMNKGWPK